MTEFFQTVMGRHFYDGTMPRIAKALEGINEKLELFIKLQTSPMVVTDGEPKVYDDGGCELCLKCGLLVSYHQGHVCMGAKEASDENNDPEAYDNRSRPLEDTSREDLDRMGALLKRATDAEARVRELEPEKTPAEDTLDKFSEAMTDAVNANEAQQMANELEKLLFVTHQSSAAPNENVLDEVYEILKKWGYGK